MTADRRTRLAEALAEEYRAIFGGGWNVTGRFADALLPVVDALCRETAANELEAAAEVWQPDGDDERYGRNRIAKSTAQRVLRDRAAALRDQEQP